MKRYIVTSNETMQYYKILEAKNEEDALKKAQLHDPKNQWKADYNNTEVIDQEVEKYDG